MNCAHAKVLANGKAKCIKDIKAKELCKLKTQRRFYAFKYQGCRDCGEFESMGGVDETR